MVYVNDLIYRKRKEFAKDSIHYLKKGNWIELDKKVDEFTNGNYAMYDTVYQALLEEGIEQGEKETLGILISKMLKVKVLRTVNEEEMNELVQHPGMIPDSPFITDNPEIMRMLLKSEYSDEPEQVIWNTEKGIRYMKAVPLAVAFEYGNKSLLELFVGCRVLEGSFNNR